MAERAIANGGIAGAPVDAEVYGVFDPAGKAWVNGKCTPQPFAALSEKIRISGRPAERIASRLYILCTDPPLPYLRQFYDAAQGAAGWETMEMPTGHDAMVTEPARLAAILLGRA